MVLFLALSLVFVAIALLALVVDPEVRGEWWPYVCLALFGAAATVFARGLLDRGPMVLIEADGISGRGVPKIRWDEIERMFRSQFRHRMSTWHFLSIVPRDGERVMTRRHPLRQLLARADEAVAGAPISLPLTHLDRSPEEILRIVERISGRRVSRG